MRNCVKKCQFPLITQNCNIWHTTGCSVAQFSRQPLIPSSPVSCSRTYSTRIITCDCQKHFAARIRDSNYQGAPPFTMMPNYSRNFRLFQPQLAPFELCDELQEDFICLGKETNWLYVWVGGFGLCRPRSNQDVAYNANISNPANNWWEYAGSKIIGCTSN
jgi:hypothetical protein